MPPSNPWRSRWRSVRSPQRFASTRRKFLQVSAAAASGVVLANCARNLGSPNLATEPGGTSGGASPTGGTNVLHVYSWTNYTDESLIQDFERETGIRVIVDTYDSNETMLARMQAGGGSAYSIIFPSDYMVSEMVELDMLKPLDHGRLQGLDQLKAQWRDPVYDPGNQHSVPVAWGTTGLIYDPEALGDEVEDWEYLWDNQDALVRQITLLNDVREVMGAALISLGYSLNSTNPDEIEEAYERLLALRPAIAAFMTNGWEDQLASGDLAISMAYSSDAILLIDESPNLAYVTPASGASLWTDTIVIPRTAPNVDAAYEWINFYMRPEVAASVVERLKFATPNQAGFELLSPAMKGNEDLFPPDAVLERSEEISPLPPAITQLYDRYWTQLTSA